MNYISIKEKRKKPLPSPDCFKKMHISVEKQLLTCSLPVLAGISPDSKPSWRGLVLHAQTRACCWHPTPLPPLCSAQSSLPDKAAVVGARRVLGKDAGLEDSAASCHSPALPGCGIPGGEEESGPSTHAPGGDSCPEPHPHQSQHT